MMYGTMTNSSPSLSGMGLFKAGIYCRLSKDDDLQGESASISNQRELLTSVCKAQGWDVAQVYQDDGFTGLNIRVIYRCFVRFCLCIIRTLNRVSEFIKCDFF